MKDACECFDRFQISKQCSEPAVAEVEGVTLCRLHLAFALEGVHKSIGECIYRVSDRSDALKSFSFWTFQEFIHPYLYTDAFKGTQKKGSQLYRKGQKFKDYSGVEQKHRH